MGLNNIRIVLVEPLYGGNIGSVCRAMKNMGLTDLALVSPSKGWYGPEARGMACHAQDILEARTEYATLAEAVADCVAVAGTSNRGGLYRGHAKTPRDGAPELLREAQRGKVALVFGREDNGLQLDEIKLCTHIIRIPSAPEYASLNLAQAVMVCAYECYLIGGDVEPIEEGSPPATSQEREVMLDKWARALDAIGFLKPGNEEHMMLGLRRIFSRGTLTKKDIQILLGVASQTLWCAGQMKKRQAEAS